MTSTTQNPSLPGAMNAPGYELLASVLQRAYDQAARGKGKERHANNKPFHHQPMQDLIRLHGVGFATGQASKKSGEALGLPTLERQVAELLGAIVYLSGAVIALEAAHAAEPKLAVSRGKTRDGFNPWNGGPTFPQGVFADTQVEVHVQGVDVGQIGQACEFNWSQNEGFARVIWWRCL